MTILVGGYAQATHCSGGPTPGAKALMSWFLGRYGGRGATNKGIYLCRPIPGSSTLSVHAEGRACDLGIPAGAGWSQWLTETLVQRSAELGVQCVIYRREIWSSAHAGDGWRPYHGSNPHTEHAHVELTRVAAAGLTVARVAQLLGTGVDWTGELIMSLPTVKTGATGAPVRRVQGLLMANGEGPLKIDGVFGDNTDACVRLFQHEHDLAVDGIVGQRTWTALLDA